MKTKDAITKVKKIYPVRGDVCVKVNAFFNEKGQRRALTGYVIDNKYFIDEQTEKIYESSVFDLINNIEDFED